jgi:hypothetical protein
MRFAVSHLPLPVLLAATLLCAAPARPAAPEKPADAPGTIRNELVGSWTCRDAWMIELSGGRGPNTLKFKEDGVYVLTARPTNSKHLFRQYGRWGADEAKLYWDTRWFQTDRGKLKNPGSPPSFVGSSYVLSSNGTKLTFNGVAFKRDALPTGATETGK